MTKEHPHLDINRDDPISVAIGRIMQDLQILPCGICGEYYPSRLTDPEAGVFSPNPGTVDRKVVCQRHAKELGEKLIEAGQKHYSQYLEWLVLKDHSTPCGYFKANQWLPNLPGIDQAKKNFNPEEVHLSEDEYEFKYRLKKILHRDGGLQEDIRLIVQEEIQRIVGENIEGAISGSLTPKELRGVVQSAVSSIDWEQLLINLLQEADRSKT